MFKVLRHNGRLCNKFIRNINTKQPSELTTTTPKQLLEKEFPDYFSDGKFVARISYVDYIDQALLKMKELGLERNIEAYKELLKVFPPGKYWPKSRFDLGLFHAPQQLCAIRLLAQMEDYRVRPDKEVEYLVIQAFSKFSDVWLKIARANYWSMKGRNIDLYPVPEHLPDKPHELAKIALVRMLDDPKSIITVKNTDETWIVQSQSPVQQAIIERLEPNSLLYIENQGLTYVDRTSLSYFVLKVYDDDDTRKRRSQKKQPDFNFNTVKMKFYGKPIKEKLEELDTAHHDGDAHILAIGITGTSSQNSLQSWLRLLQQRNPKLKDMNVIFKSLGPPIEVNSSRKMQDSNG